MYVSMTAPLHTHEWVSFGRLYVSGLYDVIQQIKRNLPQGLVYDEASISTSEWVWDNRCLNKGHFGPAQTRYFLATGQEDIRKLNQMLDQPKVESIVKNRVQNFYEREEKEPSWRLSRSQKWARKSALTH